MARKKSAEPGQGSDDVSKGGKAPPPPPSYVDEVDDFGLPIRTYTNKDADSSDSAADDFADAVETVDQQQQQPSDRQTVGQGSHSKFDDTRQDTTTATTTTTDKSSTRDAAQGPSANASGSTDTATSAPAPAPAPEPAKTEMDSPANETVKGASSDGTKAAATARSEPITKPQDPEKTGVSSSEAAAATQGHTKNIPSVASQQGGLSGFSHQQTGEHEDADKDKDDEDDDGGWQEMPAFAPYDMYDDNDRLIARELNVEDEDARAAVYSNMGGAGRGYTRVLMDEDAQSANSMDDNTQYLFKEGGKGTAMIDEDDEARDAMSQMQATKDLLTEGQRIAYVGIVRLEVATMVSDGEKLESTRRIRKEVATAAEALKMWGQKMMIRLYSHMDISDAEQIMIEQLADHGVVPQDLVPALHANARDTKKKAGGDSDSDNEREDDEEPAAPPPPYEAHEGDAAVPEAQTPSQLPTTAKIDIDLRWTVLCDLFLILIADSVYDSRSRVLLERVGKSLDVSWTDICRFEKRVTDAIEMQQAADRENWNEDEHMENRRKGALKKRYMMLGLATVGGGLVIGLSAGLLAPVIGAGLAAGFTTIGVAGTGSFLGGVGGAAVITSGAVASGGYIGAKAADKRTGAVKTFEYRPLHNNKRVNLIVTVSGWLTGKVDDVRLPFSTVDATMGDIYSILWEPEMLQSMGATIRILATEALTQSIQQILGSTILAALMGALQLPIILTKLSYLIDNPWTVSLDRAWAAGKILADSLIERNLGTRPITLVGYSLGSRVIFSALQELAKRGAYGVVQNVYMFGSPIVVKKEEYLRARTVVAGRFVNGFNRTDWILGYLFRLTNGGIRRVAGLAAIEDLPWMENMDVTDIVPGHMDYRKTMPKLLIRCGWSVESEEFSEIEDPDPDNHDERQRELINEIEEARKELEREGREREKTKRKSGRFSIFGRRKKTDRQEWELYEDKDGSNSSSAIGAGAGGGASASAAASGSSSAAAVAARELDDEDRDAAYQGALFDVDAIRAELARDASDEDSKRKQQKKEEEEEKEEELLQVREIKSTLPPMKLDLSSPKSTTSYGGYNDFSTGSGGVGLHDRPDDGIHMTFDTAFDGGDKETSTGSYRHQHRMSATSSTSPSSPTRRAQTATTLSPAATSNPWGDVDDDDFGQGEEEISMTFA
ncbi:Protein of unknown function (DUF726) [Geosmithia morbida]|uniref:DUF726 domain protein n=1 Tax=Geosmithia morbida TaxID=1094350 RepID=A0A9P4YWC0_9HYPO|nr:Protein of unknown function (DUF726) [Geosmithia morbida]KAF4124050.1 Protein of unknown function (DUF726) [Geosmithia morbida]